MRSHNLADLAEEWKGVGVKFRTIRSSRLLVIRTYFVRTLPATSSNYFSNNQAVFALDSNTVQKLASMLTGDTSEEQKEEVITLLKMYQNAEGWDAIGTYLVGEFDNRNDLAIETAIAALHRILPAVDTTHC